MFNRKQTLALRGHDMQDDLDGEVSCISCRLRFCKSCSVFFCGTLLPNRFANIL